MAHILQSKNLATRFQILVEIAANQPTIHQKSIASKLKVTPQAISEYMSQLEDDGWVISSGRSKYQVTQEGINWVLKMLRQMDAYADYVRDAITQVTICAAVADEDLAKGQPVALIMKDGLLTAIPYAGHGARGLATSDAKRGADIGISGIEGIVEFEKGRITILKIPDIQNGGSRMIASEQMQQALAKADLVGAIGIESVVALKRLGIESQYTYGVIEAAVEASRTGRSFLIICTPDSLPELVSRLENEKIEYRIIDQA